MGSGNSAFVAPKTPKTPRLVGSQNYREFPRGSGPQLLEVANVRITENLEPNLKAYADVVALQFVVLTHLT
jgi:hypothetical protein